QFLTAEIPEMNINHTSFFSSSVPSALSAVRKKNLIHKPFISYKNETDIFNRLAEKRYNHPSKFISGSSRSYLFS
ncbi:hypothetical protein QT995_26760, partial [Microcoleus sp. S36b_A3]|uniref:hypothetical protein n=1 Tax=unclassified Microcoleus TaxID=2642155 RepID=UPI002FD5F7B1